MYIFEQPIQLNLQNLCEVQELMLDANRVAFFKYVTAQFTLLSTVR